VAWAFEDIQRGFATLASFVAVVVGLFYVRGKSSLEPSRIIISSLISTLVFILIYLAFLEWVTPNPRRLPLYEITLAPALVGLYALPFFLFSLGLAIFGWGSAFRTK
jgi:amino acid permease